MQTQDVQTLFLSHERNLSDHQDSFKTHSTSSVRHATYSCGDTAAVCWHVFERETIWIAMALSLIKAQILRTRSSNAGHRKAPTHRHETIQRPLPAATHREDAVAVGVGMEVRHHLKRHTPCRTRSHHMLLGIRTRESNLKLGALTMLRQKVQTWKEGKGMRLVILGVRLEGSETTQPTHIF